MKLTSIKPYRACNVLKQILIENDYLDENGISSAEHIYIGGVPAPKPPKDFIVIEPNGDVADNGQYAMQYILFGIYTRLDNDNLPNVERGEYLFNKLEKILSNPIDKDNCFFSITRLISTSDNILAENGYSYTIININVKILEQ